MGHPPHITVVIPTRNRRGHLQRALRSSLGQRDVEVRVVVIDEASEDDTLSWLEGIDDPRLTIIRHSRSKVFAPARHAGTQVVEAPWGALCRVTGKGRPVRWIWVVASTVTAELS